MGTATPPAELRTSEGVDKSTTELIRLGLEVQPGTVDQRTIKPSHYRGICRGELINASSNAQPAAGRLASGLGDDCLPAVSHVREATAEVGDECEHPGREDALHFRQVSRPILSWQDQGRIQVARLCHGPVIRQ